MLTTNLVPANISDDLVFKGVKDAYVIEIQRIDGASVEEAYRHILREIDGLCRFAVDNNIFMSTSSGEIQIPKKVQSIYNDKGNRLMTVKECSEYLHIGINNMYGLCRQSDFPVIKIGKKQFIDKQELDDVWIPNQRVYKEDK